MAIGPPSFAASPRPQACVVAVGHTILANAYHLLAKGAPYDDLGTHHLDIRDAECVKRRSVQRVQALGCIFNLERVSEVAQLDGMTIFEGACEVSHPLTVWRQGTFASAGELLPASG